MCAALIPCWVAKLDWPSLLTGAAVGIPINVLCGLYAGLVVARWARFESLRSEVKRFILAVDFSQEGPLIKFTLNKPLVELLWTTSDLLSLHHKSAAEKALQLQKEITNSTGPSQGIEMTFEQARVRYLLWQEMCREMRPSWKVVLSLKPKL